MMKFVSKVIGSILLNRKKIDLGIVFVEDNPDPGKVTPRKLFVVGGKGYAKWVYMKCPCGCGEILTLSLMKKHKPCWSLKIDKLNRATLSPSIWKEDGCRSHFWIRKGKLEWAVSE
jgi:hypothetical protein